MCLMQAKINSVWTKIRRHRMSYKGLHCMPLIQQLWKHQQAVKWTYKNQDKYGKDLRCPIIRVNVVLYRNLQITVFTLNIRTT